MKTQLPDYIDRVRASLREFFPGVAWQITPLKGDGSNRRYAHVRHGNDALVAMILPQGEGGKSEEASGVANTSAELPFLNIARYLQGYGLPVPLVHGFSPSLGVLLLEDLGQRHLADEFVAGFPSERYHQALTWLSKFQVLKGSATDCILFARRYEVSLWHWEFEHFYEYGVQARSGQKLLDRDQNELNQVFAALAERIAACGDVPVHRDYHCRNLMIDRNNRLRWIDFQDALLGPALYDVASLLYDAYVDISAANRQALFDDYLALAQAQGLSLPADAQVMLDLIAVQRMLKAAGRFVFFEVKKGLQGYTQHIPGLLKRVQQIIASRRHAVPELGALYDLQKPLVPEWH